MIVTDENGCVSDAASVEIDITNSIAQPVIVSNAPVCEGEEVSLSIEEYAGTDVTYTWTKDGALLTSENSHVITIDPASVSDEGDYVVTVSVDDCDNTSAIFTLDIHVQPTASIAPVGALECTASFDELTLDATGTGTGVLTYA